MLVDIWGQSCLTSPLKIWIPPDIECGLSKFEDDAKLGGSVDLLLKGRQILQRDLDRFNQWAKDKHMRFSKGKCWILHLSCSNHMQCYRLVGSDLRDVK